MSIRLSNTCDQAEGDVWGSVLMAPYGCFLKLCMFEIRHNKMLEQNQLGESAGLSKYRREKSVFWQEQVYESFDYFPLMFIRITHIHRLKYQIVQ